MYVGGIPDAIRDHKQVTIYSGGCGACATRPSYAVTRLLKAGDIHGPCVTYTSINDLSRTRFNFCREQDIACIDEVYKALLAKHPDASVLLRGSSKGAANTLSFLAHKAARGEDTSTIKAAVLDCPPLSVKRAISSFPASHTLARLSLPNYDPHQKSILDARSIPQIPLFFGCIPGDSIADAADIGNMAQHMRAIGNDNVYCFTVSQSVKHGGITTLPEYTRALNAFYKKHGLVYSLSTTEEPKAEIFLNESKV